MDTVITGLFHAGLSLQTDLDLPQDAASGRGGWLVATPLSAATVR